MGEDRDGHLVWYDNFNYDFKGLPLNIFSTCECNRLISCLFCILQGSTTL